MSVIGWPVSPPDTTPSEVVGDMVVSTPTPGTGYPVKNIGREIVSTDLAGSWLGNAMSRFVEAPYRELDEIPAKAGAYAAGDNVNHNSLSWVSHVDNNIWEPGVWGWSVVDASAYSAWVVPTIDGKDRYPPGSVIDMGHSTMLILIESNGSVTGLVNGCKQGSKIKLGTQFTGRLYKMTDYYYQLTFGLPGDSGFGELLYPCIVGADRKFTTIFTNDTAVVVGADTARRFTEAHWFQKISDEADDSIMSDIRVFTDQWVDQYA